MSESPDSKTFKHGDLVPYEKTDKIPEKIDGKIAEVLSKICTRERQDIEEYSEVLDRLMEEHGAVTFLEKFERQRADGEGFEIGERVAAPFLIVNAYTEGQEIDRTKIGLLVERVNVQEADTFIIEVSPEEYALCQQQKGMEFSGVVEVTGEKRYKASNMFEYPAKVIALEFNLPINPENVRELEYGDRVMVEGTIVDFQIVEHWENSSSGARSAILTVSTSEGGEISLMVDPNLSFDESSQLENINRKVPEIGDQVRINAIVRKYDIRDADLDAVDNPYFARYIMQLVQDESTPRELLVSGSAMGAAEDLEAGTQEDHPDALEVLDTLSVLSSSHNDTKVAFADWCRSTYLLEPSPERQTRYDELRERARGGLSLLNKQSEQSAYEDMRSSVAMLVKLETTQAERLEIKELVATMPDDERPITGFHRTDADGMNKTFDVDIDRMTLREYYDFAKTSVSTPYAKQDNAREGNHSYLFSVMRDIDMPPEQMEELLVLSLDVRWEYFQELKREGQEIEQDRNRSDVSMLEKSINYLSSLESPSAVEALIERVYQIVMAEDIDSGKRGEFILGAASSLNYAFYSAKDKPELLDVFHKNAEKIREAEKKLVDIQVENPQSEFTPQIIIPGSMGQDGMVSMPTISHRYSEELRALRIVLDGISPEMKALKEGPFQEEITSRMREHAMGNAFFSAALEAVQERGYIFKRFQLGDSSVPENVQLLMSGRNGAVTVKSTKTVYFDVDALRNHAYRLGITSERAVLGAIVDESFHIMSDLDFKQLEREETLEEVERMKLGSDTLPTEAIVHRVIEEELSAYILSEEILKQLDNPEYKIKSQDFSFPDGELTRRLVPAKIQYSKQILKRVYGFEDKDLMDDQFKIVFERLVGYLNSGSVEEAIKEQLAKYGLIE